MSEHTCPHGGQSMAPELGARPRHSGLVVPYISPHHRTGRPAFGIVDGPPLRRCLADGLCGVCGGRLGGEVIVLARAADLRAGRVIEPGLHPGCFDYTRAACPMVSGAMDTHHKHPDRRRCTDRSCWCHGRGAEDGVAARAGQAAPAWYAVRLPRDNYRTVPHSPTQPGVMLNEHILDHAHAVRAVRPPHLADQPQVLHLLFGLVSLATLTDAAAEWTTRRKTKAARRIPAWLHNRGDLLAIPDLPGTAARFSHLARQIVAASDLDGGITLLGWHFCQRPHDGCPHATGRANTSGG
ncbi:hypothetical protein [Actinocatenispora rupis]|uniref:Uncharacterized protein n=1 Tax=Actinocatenispora rupis TaxID=519421 RepID=A0A8J3IWZ0_9ACTN|nr:hypothetical protein [Actinocatenispora rupis]GID10208.1 hypothetical protein Aru02nite_10970 [Actinocatenispora rupis]